MLFILARAIGSCRNSNRLRFTNANVQGVSLPSGDRARLASLEDSGAAWIFASAFASDNQPAAIAATAIDSAAGQDIKAAAMKTAARVLYVVAVAVLASSPVWFTVFAIEKLIHNGVIP